MKDYPCCADGGDNDNTDGDNNDDFYKDHDDYGYDGFNDHDDNKRVNRNICP